MAMSVTLSLHGRGTITAYAEADQRSGNIAIKVNGAILLSDSPAFLQHGRVMVPLRTVAEAMGAKVTWNATKKTASAVKEKHSFELSAGMLNAVKDGSPIMLDTAPVMKEGRLFIPLRFSAEGLGGRVRWNNSSREANIYPNLTPEEARQELKKIADQVIHALRDQDFSTLAKLSHAKGVTFSPYAFVDRDNNVTLTTERLSKGFKNEQVYKWGSFDGSGKPIVMNFKDYYQRFVYSENFAKAPFIGFNESMSYGNTMNNASKEYPEAVIIEYHFDGFNPEYAGMDWQSLRLVFQLEEGSWRLSGIIHDEWTI